MVQKRDVSPVGEGHDDPARLARGYRKITQVSCYVISPAIVGMALVAEPLVMTLVGEKWRQTVPFLQVLRVFGAALPPSQLNLNDLKVVGRSDLFLKAGGDQVVSSYVGLFINMYYTRRLTDYSIPEQIGNVANVLWLSGPMAFVVWLVERDGLASPLQHLLLTIAAGAAVYWSPSSSPVRRRSIF